MDVDIEEIKRYIEKKIDELKKEIEIYEYILSLLESGEIGKVKGNKASVDYVKSASGDIIAEVYFTPPVARFLVKKRLALSPFYLNTLNKVLEREKESKKIEYEIITDKNSLKEINISNVTNTSTFSIIKVGIETILEKIPSE